MEKKSFFWWFIFVLLCIWQFPQFLVSLVMIPFIGKLEVVGIRHFNICFKASKMYGGISLGPFSFVDSELTEVDYGIPHELDGHTVQSKILGVLYLFVVGIPSIFWATFSKAKCYYNFYTESWANKCANIETVHLKNGKCYCKLKK